MNTELFSVGEQTKWALFVVFIENLYVTVDT